MIHLILGRGAPGPAPAPDAPAARSRRRSVADAVISPSRAPSLWRAVAFAAGAWCLLSPGRALAFCRTTTCAVKVPPKSCVRDQDTSCWASGIPLSWNEQCLSFSVNLAGSKTLGLGYDAALAIVQEAFAHWPNATCADGGFPTVAFSALPGLTCERVEFNSTGPNANAILFRDDVWTHDENALALTTVAFNVRTGQILNADMEINTLNPQMSVDALPFIVTHESGHFVGLDHAPDPGTVMFAQYVRQPGAPFELSDDDVAAVCAAYPPSRSVPATCDFEPPKGYATDCGGDVQAACAVAPSPAGDRHAWRWGVLLAAAALMMFRARAKSSSASEGR